MEKGKAQDEEMREIRLIVIGNTQVGKTSLVMRYTEDKFNITFAPTLGKALAHTRE